MRKTVGQCLLVLLAAAALSAAQQLPWWWELSGPDNNPQTPPPNTIGGDSGTGAGGGTGTGAGGGGSGSGGPPAVDDPFGQSSYWPCECGEGKSCMCVLYYQCENDTIKTWGEDLLDERINIPKVETCPGVQRCCQEPPSATTSKPIQTEKPPPTVQPVTPPTRNPVTQQPVTPPQQPVKSGCGVRRGQSPLGDNSTEFAEFPWMLVVLVAEYPNDGKPPVFIFKCGGSLVHPQVALTAAHCVKRRVPTDLKVRAGQWDLTSTIVPISYQERRVIRIVRHPLFEERTLFNDIALLILDKNFDPAPNVDVACLPPPFTDFTGVRCLATGWGTSGPDTEQLQTTMKKVELPIVDHDTCQNDLRTTRLGRYFQLHESFICAGGEPNVDTCRGPLHSSDSSGEVLTNDGSNTETPQARDDSAYKLVLKRQHRASNHAYTPDSTKFFGKQTVEILNRGDDETNPQFYNLQWRKPQITKSFPISFTGRTQTAGINAFTHGLQLASKSYDPLNIKQNSYRAKSQEFQNPRTETGVAHTYGTKSIVLRSAPHHYHGASHQHNWHHRGQRWHQHGQARHHHGHAWNHNGRAPYHYGGVPYYNRGTPYHYKNSQYHNNGAQNHQNCGHRHNYGFNRYRYNFHQHHHGGGPYATNTNGGATYPTNINTNGGALYPTNTKINSGVTYPTNTNTNGGTPYPTNTNGGALYPTNSNITGGALSPTNTKANALYPTNSITNSGAPYPTNTNTNGGAPYPTSTNTNGGTHDNISPTQTSQTDNNIDYGWLHTDKTTESNASPEVTPIDGDGGGPLICPIEGDPGRYIQVGIVSWGIGCGGSRTPAVYASLSYFRNWVDQQLEDNKFVNIALPPPSVDTDERVKVPTQ